MSNEKRLRAKISNQVFGEIKGGVDDAKERGENYANNTTIHLTPKAEIEPVLDEKKGLKTVMTSIGKHADAVEKELEKKFKVNSKETDKEISEFNKDLETLQKNLKNAGSKADEIANRNKELNKVREIKKLEDLDKKDSDGKKLKTFIDLHNNTSYKSDNENLLINGKKQLDIWNQDEEKISNSKKLNVADKAQLTDLSKTQKQLNTLKERQLKIIQDIQGKESKTEKDIIKQYDAAVKLNKILELMSENRTKISDIVSKEYSDNTIANNWTSKTSVPAKVEKYIESLNLKVNDEDDGDNGVEYLKKALTAAYKKGLKDAQAEKDEYIEDKEFKETQAIDPKKVEKAKNQIPQIQEKIFNHEQSLDSQMNNLEQDALKSVEDYLKVADKDNKDTFKKLETALGKIGTYIGSGGELDTINAGLENILKDNHNLGGESEKQKKLFSANLDSLKTTLNSVEDFQETSKKYFEETRFDKQIEIQMDKEVAALQNKIKELHERIKTREDYIETGRKVGQVASDNIHVSKAQTNTYIEEQTEIKNGIMNTDVPISIIPEVEPEKFVDEITQQLKGHSAKVDVELNKEIITEEIKKITEMIPDKKVIEVSINMGNDQKVIENVGTNDTSVASEVKKQNEIQKELKETDEQVQKVMYHYGVLNERLGGKKTHQFGDEISAYTAGIRNGNRGWADGTGTYVTNDATEFPPSYKLPKDTQKKFFALDTSKLKLYEAHIEEEAQKFYEFQHKLEQFVIALGSGFKGFDGNIDNVDSETLYKEAKSVFSKYPEIFNKAYRDFNEFDAFIDEMINLVNASGMSENGIEAKNTKRLMQFKKDNGVDDIKTRFLKSLGFQGTDLSGTSYGGIQTGSVIFDIEEAPVIASGNTINEVLEKIGTTAEETKYKVAQVTETAKELTNTAASKGSVKDNTVHSVQTSSETIRSTQKNETDIISKLLSGKHDIAVTPVLSEDFDANGFVQSINSKLVGKEVPIDVVPSDNTDNFLKRLSSYSEKFEDLIKNQPIIQTPEKATQENLEGNKQYDASEEISGMNKLAEEVSKVTTAVDEKTEAFRKEGQVVTETVQKEIGELERLAGQLHSVQDDIGKIATTITSLPKIDFDVDLSKLNIENIDGASIASFNSFREQLAGLEAQLNVSNLSSKLVEISNAFTTLSGLKLDNLNTKNLNLTRITNLTKKSEDINTLVDALDALGECLERLKNDGSFDKDYFTGLKFSAKNVNNMADMAVALETVGIALRQFDKEAKDALSSINKLAENAKGLKNLNSIIKAPKKVKKVQEAIENEDKPKEPTVAQTNKATTIDDNISNGTYEKELKQVEQRYAKLQDTVDITQGKAKELSEAFKDLKEADAVESKIQAFDNFKNALASAKNELTGLEKERSTKSFTDEVNTQLKSIQEQYGNSSYLKNSLSSLETEIERISASAKEGSADLTNLGKQAKTAFANFQKGVLPSGDFKGIFSGLEDAVEQAKKTVDSYSKVKSELKTPLQLNDDGIAKMTAQVIDFNGQLKNLTFVYNDTTKSMVQQTTNVRTELLGIPGVVDAIKHKLKDMAVYWTATLFDPYDILSSFRQVAEVVIDLNSQMTELAKVSGLSIDQLENRFGKWANTAKELGATVSDTISASADWSRLGYSIDEAEKLAEVAILYKNVGDGIDIEAANESLVSTMQGFQLEANQAESVIDSFNEVDLFASCYSNVVACINFT